MRPVRRLLGGCLERLPEPPEVVRERGHTLVLRMREEIPHLLRAFGVEHLEHADRQRPIRAPRGAHLLHARRGVLRGSPERQHHLQRQHPDSEMVDPRNVLALEARLRVRLEVPEAVGEGHPRGRRPVPRVAREVRAAPILLPRARPHCKAEVDQGEVRRRVRVDGYIEKHIVRGDVPVERDRLQQHEDAGELYQDLMGHAASASEGHAPLPAPGQRALHQCVDAHGLVLLVTDAVQPLVQGPAFHV
mmetsp:Transcript_90379/g.276786  ORF Transcript_90379/g.276786 Transcript_90379/m.276786 type:complete len:247 (+) Transcript_90379:410-1150(+)